MHTIAMPTDYVTKGSVQANTGDIYCTKILEREDTLVESMRAIKDNTVYFPHVDFGINGPIAGEGSISGDLPYDVSKHSNEIRVTWTHFSSQKHRMAFRTSPISETYISNLPELLSADHLKRIALNKLNHWLDALRFADITNYEDLTNLIAETGADSLAASLSGLLNKCYASDVVIFLSSNVFPSVSSTAWAMLDGLASAGAHIITAPKDFFCASVSGPSWDEAQDEDVFSTEGPLNYIALNKAAVICKKPDINANLVKYDGSDARAFEFSLYDSGCEVLPNLENQIYVSMAE